MLFEYILVIVGLIGFIIYNICFTYINNNKTPQSISATSYISREKYGTSLPFVALCIIAAVFLFPLWIDKTPDEYQFLVFLACAGVLFAGSTPLYRQEFESKIHYTGGTIAFVCGLLWLILMHQWITLGLIGLIGGIWSLLDRKNYTFIFEFVSYIAICLSVMDIQK